MIRPQGSLKQLGLMDKVLFIGSFIIRGAGLFLSFLVVSLVAKNVSPDIAGEYFYFVQVLVLLSTIIRFGSSGALLKYAHAFAFVDVMKVFRHSAVIASGIVVVIIAIGFVVSHTHEIRINSFSLFGYGTLLLVLLPFSLLIYIGDYLNGIGKFNLAVTLQTTLIPLSLCLFFIVGSLELNIAYMLSIFMSLCIGLGFYYFNRASKTSCEDNKKVVRLYKKELTGFCIISVMAVIMASLDTLMIAELLGMESVARYNVANKMALLSSVFLVAVNAIFAPQFSKLWQDNDIQQLKDTFFMVTKYMAAASIVFFSGFVIFGEYALVVVFGEIYVSSYGLMLVMAASQSVVLATGPVAYLLMMTGNAERHRNSLFLAVVINVLLNIILIPSFGIMGAAAATGLSLIFKNIYSCIMAVRFFAALPSD